MRDINKTVVIFRKYKDNGDILALFPYDNVNAYNGNVLCYEHVGQHGHANYNQCINITVPATKKEYKDLLNELTSNYSYDFKIQKTKCISKSTNNFT